jgi:hypothetical protein
MVRNENRLEVIPVSSLGSLGHLIANLSRIKIRWITAELDSESHLYSLLRMFRCQLKKRIYSYVDLAQILLKTATAQPSNLAARQGERKLPRLKPTGPF